MKNNSNYDTFPQIPAIHVQAEVRCKGELIMLGGDGESGEGMTFPFYMQCEKCGETDFYNEETAAKGCHFIIESVKIKDENNS